MFKEFFKDIKDRLTSPLISSFIISWLVINWKVPIGLFFYKNQELSADYYKSPIDLITKVYSPFYFILLPLFTSCLYVFCYPWIKNLIHFYQLLVNKNKEDITIKMTSENTVQMHILYDIKRQYKEKETELSILLRSEQEKYLEKLDGINTNITALQEEVNSLKSINRELTFTKDTLDKQLSDINYYSNLSNIQGKWEYKVTVKTQQLSGYLNITDKTITPTTVDPEIRERTLITFGWIAKEQRIIIFSKGTANEIYLEKLEASPDFRYLFGTVSINGSNEEPCSYKKLTKEELT
ncbi:hypothetical protein QEG73_15045 [Chitinophagaceae bacterium 26-R-25]|nr:hypothetical protein [Chitinophagaceae bacterium 26-R-25]